MNGGGI